MQGIVYTEFSELVIDKFGMKMWNDLLDEVQPESGGVYTSGMTYKDEEAIALITALSEKTGIPASDLLKVFGEVFFGYLIKSLDLPEDLMSSLKKFLKGIDDVIHKEVKRLNPEAYLPVIAYEDNGKDGELVLLYRSKRKLCALAEGLIFGAASHFNNTISIQHTTCMHKGADECRLELSFKPETSIQ